MLYNFLSWDSLLCYYLDSERKKLNHYHYITNVSILFRGPRIFYKFRNCLKIIGAWKVTRSNFHDDMQVLGITIQNLIIPLTFTGHHRNSNSLRYALEDRSSSRGCKRKMAFEKLIINCKNKNKTWTNTQTENHKKKPWSEVWSDHRHNTKV